MKKILRGLTVLLVLCLPMMVYGAAPKMIVGGQGECDTTNAGCLPFPSSSSFLCQGTGVILDCPQYASPDWSDSTGLIFYGITNRANPARCVKSTNGGGTWGLCNAGTVSPFTGVLNNNGANFAVTNSGTLLAAASQGTNLCIIRRSTDGGANWTTVFTDSTTVNVSCGIGFGSPTPNTLRCASSGNYCVMIAFISGTFDLVAYYSTNDGVSWTKGTNFNIVSGDAQIGVTVAADGNSGSLTRYGITFNNASWTFASTSGADWTKDGVIPVPPAEAGTAARCVSGAMIFGGQSVLCGPANVTFTTKYLFYTHGAGSTSFAAGVIPQNGLTNAQAPDFMAVGFNSTTAYVVGRSSGSTQVVIWITRDTFSTMLQLGTLTPTTALIGGCCRGDIFVYNGKIYFTSGATGGNAFFGVIQ